MTDVAKLIAADRPVRLMPDRAIAEDLAKLDAFWKDDGATQAEGDLSFVSDAELRDALQADGIDSETPAELGRVATNGNRIGAAAALAACLAGAAVTGGVLWQNGGPEQPQVAARKEPAPELDPYILARPDRPAAGAGRVAEAEPRSGFQPASDGRVTLEVDLTRAEIHEMQRLLDLLGYGPLVRNGLPSDALDRAMGSFRADRGLAPEDQAAREGLVMLRLVARVNELRASGDEENPTKGE